MASALLAACSEDDDPTPANGGSGGSSAGASGAAGAAGAAGSAGAAGAAGSAGAAGAAGNGPTPPDGSGPDGGSAPPCRDCVELRVPVDDSDQTATFQFQVGPYDMRDASIYFRMRTLTVGAQLLASPFARDADLEGFAIAELALREDLYPEDTWVTISLSPGSFYYPPPAAAADAGADGGPSEPDSSYFDASNVTRFGLKVGSSANYAGPAKTVVVLVDTVSFERIPGNPLGEKNFDEDVEGFSVDVAESVTGAEIIHHPAN
ncbi:MAG TPA: hypothetical protein VMG12_00375 [Polyangiaceae bacterium]|nr:hypothetical protein [Polyangiaceae bacterium]